ncbi:hypothetical protein LD119_00713 [Mesoplasma sp. JKS002660]|uniref:hypothetical protein n=1 Tax=Mesoplasma whartonense TaxID=2878854 RepID=UPI002022A6A1|nr:hypothetical protein [Mesoplasma sp. JKS002660]MCL8213762.1 hypothetical protein [Mesoplasma sp. JKS002660]
MAINQIKKTVFDVFEEYPQLLSTHERQYLIGRLARERVDEFAWKELTTSVESFDQQLKDDQQLWQKFYDVSWRAFDEHDGWGILVVMLDNQLRLLVTRISSFEYSNLEEQLNNIQCYFGSVAIPGGNYQCNLEFKRINDQVTFDFILNNGKMTKTADEQLKEKLIAYFGLATDFKTIPVVLWKTNPFDIDELGLEKEICTRLEFIHDILPDQILNSMTKKETNFNDSATGLEDIQTEGKEFVSTHISRVNGSDPNYQSSQALYQPSDSMERFSKQYDWELNKIKDYSNSIKDDDEDSAQKTKTEMWSINRTATSQLETNKATFESCIKQVVEIIQIIKNEPAGNIEVTLNFATVAETIVGQAEGSIKDDINGGSTNE